MTNENFSDRHETYKPNEMPKKIIRKLFIGYGIGRYNYGRIVVDDFERSQDKDFAVVPLLEKELTIDIPRCKVDVKGRMLEVLEEQRQEILAENHRRLKTIDEEIARLKVLEYKPAE